MSTVNKAEILFLYDLSWGNPNGDPNDENKPRVDSETGINIVTDVRLKRTVRDDLDQKGYDILVKDTLKDDGSLADGKHRGTDFMPESAKEKVKKQKDKAVLTQEELNEFKENVLKCIDIRMFGCVLPSDAKNASLQFTGPVQFKMGYSMHPVKVELIKGTGAFASGEGKDQKTFRQEFVVPYSLINFYGIVNSRAAEITGLTNSDVKILLNSIWHGTKNLITRTKAGQMPRVLLHVEYKEKDFYIGELDKRVEFAYSMVGESVRKVSDGVLKFERLIKTLTDNKDKIESVSLAIDSEVRSDVNLADELQKANITVNIIA
jgi:CRISPR-associated protein Csh2